MDRLTAAFVFVETVARGSISAAGHLGLSRAMATRYIASMEDWAGARLLHRTTRKLSLTPAGEDVLATCKEMVVLANGVRAIGAEAGSVPKGLIRMTAPAIFAEHSLAEPLLGFLNANPAVRIDLQVADTITNLAEEGTDLAIRVTKALDSILIARRLGEVRSIICAAPKYLEEHGVPVKVSDLGAHNCLTYTHYGRDSWQFKVGGATESVPVSGNFSSNDASIVLRAAIQSGGIALLPDFAVQQAVHEGRLVRLFSEAESETLGVYAVYLSRLHMSKALRALIDYLAKNLTLR